MTQAFKLIVDCDAPAPRITVESISAPGTPPATLELPRDAGPPYRLEVAPAASAPDTWLIRVAEPFDPEVTRDSNVLHVGASLSDHRFGTQDDTKYILHLTNKSRYYLAEDIQVRARIATDELPRLPDGNLALSLTPGEQHLPCIDPGQTRDLAFVAVARGPKPGLYTVEVELAYRLVYWDGRRARDASRHVLPVHGPGTSFELPPTSAPARMPRQPTLPRSPDMSESPKPFLAPLAAKPQHRRLNPIEQQFSLPGGGHLVISYRLLKGHRLGEDEPSCTYGRHPESDSIESYFSTQDTAVLEVTLENQSHHHLKHLRIEDLQLTSVEDKAPGKVVDQTLPDGNLLFEVVPDNLYFGHLAPHARTVKYLSLITRGIQAGHYSIKVQVHYDIEHCQFPVDLWLTVRPD